MSKIRILQIGDLHRGKSSSVKNGPLLDSLLTDLKYQLNYLLPIDIVAVCGDLVQGTSEQTLESAEQLAAQYSEAEEFLVALGDELLSGQRDRVVIVPGNHDVSWPHSYSSMRNIEVDVANAGKKALIHSLVKESRTPSSTTRWSWEELRFQEISDKNLYSERMSFFRTFYNSFYNGLSSYDLDPECQYAIHDFGDLSVSILALNSCDCLDHCNHTAHINPNALAKALIKLKMQEFVGRTKIAIWHHGLAGEPNRVDYLDPLAVQPLIVNRFALGLHGHQHAPDFMNEIGRFGYKSRMLVVGVGTLCGTPDALPTGQMRSYNIIELDLESGVLQLFPREMKQSHFSSPVWGPKLLPYSDDYPIRTNITQEKDPNETVAVAERNQMRPLSEAESRIGSRDYEGALAILKPLDQSDPLVRSLTVECYMRLKRHRRLLELCSPPQSVRESIFALSAADELSDQDKLDELLSSEVVLNSSDPSLVEYRSMLLRRRKK